jgi:hypothetical protein
MLITHMAHVRGRMICSVVLSDRVSRASRAVVGPREVTMFHPYSPEGLKRTKQEYTSGQERGGKYMWGTAWKRTDDASAAPKQMLLPVLQHRSGRS